MVDALFFMGHDEFTGKALVGRAMLDIGLAGAVLSDLLLTGRIAVEDKQVTPVVRPRPGEPVSSRVLADITAEQEVYSVREWVDYLRADVLALVADKLAESGLVTHSVDRGLLRKSHRYPPTDVLIASGARSDVRSVVLGRQRPDLYSVSLARLAWAVGLDDLGQPELDRKQLKAWLDQASKPLTRPVSDLLSGVDAAAAAAIYTGDRK